jgi:aspartate aminotransferase
MPIRLAERVDAISPSQTIAMNEGARRLAAAGKDVIDLTLGEPDFPTPGPILEAAIAALREGYTRYTSVAGMPELRVAIAAKLLRENGLEYTPDSIVVSCGAKQSLSLLIEALVGRGDEVVIPSPCWVSYVDMVKLAEGRPVVVPTLASEGYKLSPEALEAAIGPATRALILCSPSNPTGAVYSREELAGLVAVLDRHPQVFLISDEVYERIDYSGKRASPAAFPSLEGRCAVVNGVSKAYAMTGFRLGYLAASPWLAAACAKLQGQSTTCAAGVSQRAALAALGSDPRLVTDMVDAYARRRDLVLGRLARLPGISVFPPEGAFYVFPQVRGLEAWKSAPEGRRSSAVSAWLLDKALVATVPGLAFGDDAAIRLSFATSDERLSSAFDRIEAVLKG